MRVINRPSHGYTRRACIECAGVSCGSFLVVNYGGTFEFDAAALSGDFSEANLHTGRVWALALLVNLN